METVFISNGQSGGNSSLTKRGSSPKDGSLSGDEGSGSDGGQKAEMEDSQSNCSKVSSDLTPSDDRSNEEAGSSLKESDASMKNMKGVSSVASSNSSNDHISQEEGSSVTPTRDSEDIFRKLFVPLKIRVSQKLDTPSTPHWLVEAHLSPRVAMTYKVPTRQLEDVLSEDKKKMSNLIQSATVKQQLLQLLNEVDMKSAAMVAATAAVSASTAAAAAYPLVSVTSTSPTAAVTQSISSPDSVLETIKEETCSDKIIEDSKPANEEKLSSVALVGSNPSNNISMESLAEAGDPTAAPKLASPVQSNNVSMESLTEATNASSIKTEAKSSLCEETSHLTLAKSSSAGSMESLQGSHTNKKSTSRKGSSGDNNSSDTNTDPIAEETLRSSDLSQSSSTETTLMGDSSHSGGSSRTDSHIQERFQAMESNSLSGQKIEDIIMSKVFVPVETSSTNVEMKSIPSMYSLPE